MDKFKHKHSLGQNFLKDKGCLIKIIDSCKVEEDDLVIEIGPGQGALTKYLKLYNAQLLCFEIDLDTKKYLDKFEDEKTKVIYQDFMSSDVKNILSEYKYNNLYIIANLPYYITTPILKKIIDDKINAKEMVLMVQEEVADRFSAQPGTKDYGAVTVYLNYYYEISKLFKVGRNSFDPAPNVDSAVIKMVKRENKQSVDEEKLFTLVKDSFQMKRKNLRNNLRSYDLEKIDSILAKYDLSLNNRAEDVSLDCFVEIANSL